MLHVTCYMLHVTHKITDYSYPSDLKRYLALDAGLASRMAVEMENNIAAPPHSQHWRWARLRCCVGSCWFA